MSRMPRPHRHADTGEYSIFFQGRQYFFNPENDEGDGEKMDALMENIMESMIDEEDY